MREGYNIQDLPQHVYIAYAHVAPAFVRFDPLKNLILADLGQQQRAKT